MLATKSKKNQNAGQGSSLVDIRFLSIGWNSIRVGSPAYETVTNVCKQSYPIDKCQLNWQKLNQIGLFKCTFQSVTTL